MFCHCLGLVSLIDVANFSYTKWDCDCRLEDRVCTVLSIEGWLFGYFFPEILRFVSSNYLMRVGECLCVIFAKFF